MQDNNEKWFQKFFSKELTRNKIKKYEIKLCNEQKYQMTTIISVFYYVFIFMMHIDLYIKRRLRKWANLEGRILQNILPFKSSYNE